MLVRSEICLCVITSEVFNKNQSFCVVFELEKNVVEVLFTRWRPCVTFTLFCAFHNNKSFRTIIVLFPFHYI